MARLRSPIAIFDVALAIVVAVVTEVHVFGAAVDPETHIYGPRWLTAALPLLIALPLLWRRQRPLAVTALVVAGIVAQALASGRTPEGFEFVAIWLVVPYSVAAFSPRQRALAGLALLLAGFAVYAAENDDIVHGDSAQQWAGAFFLLMAVGAWLAGLVVRGRRESAALAARARELARDAELAGERERARMARELHDIVSHNLSVVVVQAAGARAQAEGRGAEAGTLEKIERSGREALVEMRRLLGVLREDGGAPMAPPPGLAQLPALAEGLRAAGVAVELDVRCGELPPAIGLSAYRIVQEALTNTLKHAGPGAGARVAVREEAGAVTVEVGDDGAGAPAAAPRGGGHGLMGMRERVALLGGELEAGPRPDRGFAVTARLPLATPARR